MPRKIIFDFPCSETFRRYEEYLNGEPSPFRRLTLAEERKLSTYTQEKPLYAMLQELIGNSFAKKPIQRKDRGAGGVELMEH